MPRNVFTAIDPNGVEHKRTSESREYAHTVVFRKDKRLMMHYATQEGHTKQDGSNYDYYRECAAGTHEHVTHVTGREGYHPSYSDADVARMQAAQREKNAKSIAYAKTQTDGLSRDAYIKHKRAERVARVEATDFNEFHNAGWCGRLDLAQKLAGSIHGVDVTILPAVKK